MNAYERQQLRTKINGISVRENQINTTKKIFENKFEHDPSYIKNIDIIGKSSISARINNFRKEGFLQPKMDIQSTIDNEFNLGDLLNFKDQYWLVTMKNNFYDMNFEGECVQCNNILRFQLPNEDNIYEYYCVAERPYAVNTTTGLIVQTSAKEYRLRLQLDDITKKLYLGQRFILGSGYREDGAIKPDIYKIASRDQISNAIIFEEGFLVLNLEEDEAQMDVDNLEYLIANYRKTDDILPIIPSGCQIRSLDNQYQIKLGAFSTKLFEGEVFDDKGKKIYDLENILFDWDLVLNELQEKHIKYDNSEKNIIKIRCDMPKSDIDANNLLNSQFELVLNAKDGINNIDFEEFKVVIKIISLI